MALCGCSHSNQTVVEEAATPAQQLLERLAKIQEKGFAFGHHDDTAYGHYWEYTPDSSDVRSATGDYPAIINWDLGMIELDSARNLDGVPFEYMRQQIKAQHARGGINSISWHLRNPLTGGDAWDTSDSTVVSHAVAEGDSVNAKLLAWTGKVAAFIASLKDDNGVPIPVIFRPWHEHTGDWFWWGKPYCTAQEYKNLWAMTRKVFDDKEIDNVVWAYSPDKSNCSGLDDYMERYPGDDYIDIMGADVYHFNGEQGNEAFTQWMTATLGSAVAAAKAHDKIAALTETGSEGLVLDDWYMNVLLPAIKDYPIAYITVWRNGFGMEKHFYVPYPGHHAIGDFVEFYKQPSTLFLNDIKELK